MSWFDDTSRRRAGALAVVLALALAGCGSSGFRPVYGSLGVGPVDDALRSIAVDTIPGRVGQRVRNEIQFNFNETQNVVDPVYRLEIVLNEQLTTTLVRSDGISNSQVYTLLADFKLVRIADKSVVFQGKSIGRAPFERTSSIYSNVRAREDAENRASKVVGTEIHQRVSTYLSRSG